MFASHETHCFEATIYIDGKIFCIVDNDGHGGSNNYHPLNGKTNYKEIRQRVESIDKELSKEIIKGNDFDIANCLEITIGNILDDVLLEKETKKLLRRITYLGKNNDIYQLPAKMKPTNELLNKIKHLPWWKPEYIMLNELSFEDAKQYVSQSA